MSHAQRVAGSRPYAWGWMAGGVETCCRNRSISHRAAGPGAGQVGIAGSQGMIRRGHRNQLDTAYTDSFDPVDAFVHRPTDADDCAALDDLPAGAGSLAAAAGGQLARAYRRA